MKAKTMIVAAVAAVACAQPFAAGAKTASSVHWEWCGWGGGGWFWSSAADPVNPDVFYMGGDVNGAWIVYTAGALGNGNAYGAYRCAPACVIS